MLVEGKEMSVSAKISQNKQLMRFEIVDPG